MKLALCLLLVFLASSIEARRLNVCYWGTWSHYRQHPEGKFTVNEIDPTLCTHYVYAFMNAREDGTIIHFDDWLDVGLDNINKFVALRQRSPTTKFLFSVGGWTAGSAVFSKIAASPVTRANFAQSVLDWSLRWGFDGFDFDWEYPGQREGSDPVNDKENFVLICMEIHRVLKQHNLEFGIAVGATENSARISYDIPRVAANVDFINLMTYDFHGSWNPFTGLHSAMYPGPNDVTENLRQLNVDACVKYWISQGAPPEKLILGIGAYGRSFTLASAANNGVGAPSWGGGSGGPIMNTWGFLGYHEICTNVLRHQWRRIWEPTQKCPYAVNNDQWVGYDDIESTTYKLNYILDNKLGGAMWWSIDTEDFLNLCGNGRFPLISLANEMMK